MSSKSSEKYSLTVHVSEFAVPPISDGLVVGKEAPIGFSAINKALKLLNANQFETIVLDDDVISHILIRSAVCRRIPSERLKAFVIERIRPMMSSTEVLHLDLETRVTLTEIEL